MAEQIPKFILGLGTVIGAYLAYNAYKIKKEYEKTKKEKEG